MDVKIKIQKPLNLSFSPLHFAIYTKVAGKGHFWWPMGQKFESEHMLLGIFLKPKDFPSRLKWNWEKITMWLVLKFEIKYPEVTGSDLDFLVWMAKLQREKRQIWRFLDFDCTTNETIQKSLNIIFKMFQIKPQF